jgi:hypothetical protein
MAFKGQKKGLINDDVTSHFYDFASTAFLQKNAIATAILNA